MSRKRKLYLSELLERNTNKDLHVALIIDNEYSYYSTVKECLDTIRNNNFFASQVKTWYIRFTGTTGTLFIYIF